MKTVVAAFNQEKVLVGAFSVITNLWMDLTSTQWWFLSSVIPPVTRVDMLAQTLAGVEPLSAWFVDTHVGLRVVMNNLQVAVHVVRPGGVKQVSSEPDWSIVKFEGVKWNFSVILTIFAEDLSLHKIKQQTRGFRWSKVLGRQAATPGAQVRILTIWH